MRDMVEPRASGRGKNLQTAGQADRERRMHYEEKSDLDCRIVDGGDGMACGMRHLQHPVRI
jgi:hypothetical protein